MLKENRRTRFQRVTLGQVARLVTWARLTLPLSWILSYRNHVLPLLAIVIGRADRLSSQRMRYTSTAMILGRPLLPPSTCKSSLKIALARPSRIQARLASTAISPVELHYDKVVPPDGNETEKPLVILHGLLYVSAILPRSNETNSLQRDEAELGFAIKSLREGPRETCVCFGMLPYTLQIALPST